MPRRVFEVAHELKARSRDIVKAGKSLGLQLQDHMSPISDMQMLQVRTLYKVATGQIQKAPPPLPPADRSAPARASQEAPDGAAASTAAAMSKDARSTFKDRLKKRKTLQQQRDSAVQQHKKAGFRRRERKVVQAERGGRGGAGQARRVVAPADPNRVYEVELPITVKDFSQALGVKVNDLITRLFKSGRMARINDLLDKDECELLALEFQKNLALREGKTLEELVAEDVAFEDRPEDLVTRPPVVTVLGHVDHGKTTLLDALRRTQVAAGESGGITQSISAWKVRGPKSGKEVVFIDTPGHAAFTAMRARGAATTDLVVLVVAADDGVMPQTLESISHAKAAGVPMVVALNKIDLPSANKDRALSQLAQAGLTPAEWGGDVEVIPCSALKGDGLSELIQTVLTEADLLELKANPKRPAHGVVLESHKDDERGITATLLVQNGTLVVGATLLAGHTTGKARSLFDDRGAVLERAGPATPVQVLGLPEVPEAGEQFFVMEDLDKAQEVAKKRADKKRLAALAKRRTKLDALFDLGKKELRVILKADVQGSIDALERAIGQLAISEIAIKFVHTGVGGINESDVHLADASDAVIFGFRVVAEERARHIAQAHDVEIRSYQVIYHLLDDLRAALEGMLGTKDVETVLGSAHVLQVFRASKIGTIAGCRVSQGTVARDARVRVIRDGIVIENGRQIASLRRHKDDAREVREGLECGIKVANYNDVKVGDQLQCYRVEQVKRTFDDVQ